MEFEKLQKIIAEVLNVDADEITMDTTLSTTLGQIPWMYFRLLWELKRNSTLRFRMKRQKRLFLSVMP